MRIRCGNCCQNCDRSDRGQPHIPWIHRQNHGWIHRDHNRLSSTYPRK
jgi:hypothetical protein